ncbi:histidine phosphatase family protein [Leptothrix discophora]|uniref:Histidine phosphatase family protein n=1 Tax=Leptothrix discophora TaxID=89 RepID=A0ABT9G287_LEPDI|nr:histidine phosphatase family protein [Leptothrix discophora]MDP4300591.1 histidine phosphatase family protein [Leptothrix discophora]
MTRGLELTGPMALAELRVWRHPRAQGAAGRCIGRTDLPVDRRRARRLAHRIRTAQRREGGERVIVTSTRRRAADVGRWLRRWGWHHHIDPRLDEADFGRWDGLRWREIEPADWAGWTDAFVTHRPGGGESVAMLRARVRSLIDDPVLAGARVWAVGHAGWLNALRTLHLDPLRAVDWPAPIGHGVDLRLRPMAPGGAFR